MFGYTSSTHKQEASIKWLHKLGYLIGNFDVNVYTYSSNIWIQTGNGVSNISSSDKLIVEEMKIYKGEELITINNTFGFETFERYKMTSLDLSSGDMDLYKGKIVDGKLIFCNSYLISAPKNHEREDVYTFKLVYNKLSDNENQVVIGMSRDKGKTWKPYMKSFYIRK